MKKTYILIFFVSFLCSCGATTEEIEIKSPDGTMFLRTSTTGNTLLLISIYDKNGKLLHQENTRASHVQKWSVRWLNNQKILIDSSDIGPVSIVSNNVGHWNRESPLHKLSPNGKLVAYTFWNDYKGKKLTLCFLQSDGDVESASNVVQEIETDIVINDLVDCAQWEGNSRLIIKNANKAYVFEYEQGKQWELKE